MPSILLSALGVLIAAPTADDLVRAYGDAVDFHDSFAFELSYREVCESQTKLNGVTTREGTYVVRHDRGQWRIQHAGLDRGLDDEGRLETVPTEYEFVISEPLGEVLVGSNVAQKELEYVIANLKPLPERESVGTTDNFMMLLGFNYGDGERSMVEVLEQSQLATSEDVLLGKTVWKLVGNGPHGRTTLWFDPAAGMRLIRLEKEKSGDDLLNDTSISSIPVRPPSHFSLGGKIASIQTTLDVTKFGNWGSKSFPEDAVITNTEYYVGGRKSETRYTFHVDRFSQGGLTAADFEVTTDIPDGYAVQVNDHPNLEYEWRNGEIVKAISAEARANLRASRFGSTFSIAGYFVSFAAVLLLVTALAVWLYRRGGAYR